MALTLSTLTSPTTSGDVLAEMLTTADFLDSVPVLRNIARGPNKGGDAKQTTALNQPKALPVVDGKGYLYLSGVTGNYASVPNAANLNGLTDFVMEAKDVYMGDWAAGAEVFFSKFVSANEAFVFRNNVGNINIYAVYGGVGTNSIFAHGLTGSATASIRVTRVGTSLTAELDTGSGYVAIGSAQTVPASAIDTTTTDLEIGTYFGGGSGILTGKISRAVIWDNGTQAGDPVLDVDFNATSIPHGAKKFQCATGQVVTINQSGNDPATIIKRSVLRFDGANDFMNGVFGQTITEGYMFAAFSVLGDGGDASGRIFGGNSTGVHDYQSGGFTLRRSGSTDSIQLRYNGGSEVTHSNVFDGARGDFLLESPLKAGDQNSKINNADADDGAANLPDALSSEEFIIAGQPWGEAAAIDLYWLGLFPATISPAEAARVVSWVNRRSIFDFKDGFGYYFYDGTKAPVGAISSGSASWNGRIVGSDNGDVGKYATQATSSDQPVSDGYKVTFADNTDHLDIPSTTQSGWQICGTSLGTFVYKVNANAVTELNLLGNFGGGRAVGDLYGIILLPETATGKQIESARQVLINRGAADGATSSSYIGAWYLRQDIVEFGSVDMSGGTNFQGAWQDSGLTSFPSLNLSSGTTFLASWAGAPLQNFGSVDCSQGTNFTSAWFLTTALTSFPAGAKLGTAATNVNFTSAWQSSGLTSFPALDLSSGSNFSSAWKSCSALTSFPAGAQLGTAAANVNFSNAWNASGLTSFPALDLSEGNNFQSAFNGCTSLTTIGSGVLLGTASNNVQFSFVLKNCTALTIIPNNLDLSKGDDFQQGFNGCTSLVDFPAGAFDTMGTPRNSCFVNTWGGCTALSATSVFNILSSIDTSGQSAPSTGPQITIDYDGTALSAATNTAINSLIGKGWQVVINGVITVPNVLSLAPAAAYSLRSFDSAADPNVVNVRRSSDSAITDFKASEVSDGTLRDWTLGSTLALENNRMYFDGVNDKVDVSGVDISSNSEITIKTRLLWNDSSEDAEGIFTNNNTGAGRFSINVSGNTLFMVVDSGTNSETRSQTIQAGRFYDVVASGKIDGTSLKLNLFVDGVGTGELSVNSTNSDFNHITQNWVIGYLNNARYFEGIIDYVDVYEGYSTDGSVTGMTQLHGWSNTNITDASWTDSVGSANGTVSGTPALFSGQGFDGHVTTWYDQGGTNHAAQATASSQPKIVDGGVLVTEGGLPALDFDGSNDSLRYSGDLFGANTAAMFIVNSFDVATATKRELIAGGQDTSGTRYDFVIVRQSSGAMQPYIEGSGFSGGISTYETNAHLYSLTHNGGTSTGSFGRDGVTTSTLSSSASVTSATDFVIGTDISSPSDSLNGQIQEIVVFNTDQSTNRTGIEKNINDTYTIY